MPTPAAGSYLKAIFLLPDPVGVTALAERLRVRKPSVTEMVGRLAEEGLVERRRDRGEGIRLTEAGRKEALFVLRRHRLLKAFLVECLGLDPSEVAEDAEMLEHHLPDRVAAAMDWTLGHPPEDPHGHPIPDGEGRVPERTLVALQDLGEGDRAVVREMHGDSPDRLRRWFGLGLAPGAGVAVVARRDVDGVLEIRVADRTEALGRDGLEGIFVEPLLTARSGAG